MPALNLWVTVMDVSELHAQVGGGDNVFPTHINPAPKHCFVFLDNEAVIIISIKGRTPTIRLVPRTHRIDLDWTDSTGACDHSQVRQHDTAYRRHLREVIIHTRQTVTTSTSLWSDVTHLRLLLLSKGCRDFFRATRQCKFETYVQWLRLGEYQKADEIDRGSPKPSQRAAENCVWGDKSGRGLKKRHESCMRTRSHLCQEVKRRAPGNRLRLDGVSLEDF